MMLKKSLICLLLSMYLLCLPALAYTVDDIEWKDGADKTGTLAWGGTLTIDSYVIKAEDFNAEGFVSISISRNNQVKAISPLRVGETLTYRDTDSGNDIKVVVDSVTLNIDSWTGNMKDPKTAVKVYKRAYPKMKIDISTDKDTYDPRYTGSSIITATINIKNEGDAKAYNMDVEIDSCGMEQTSGKIKYSFNDVEEDEVLEPIVVKFKASEYWDQTKIDFKVTTKSKDINNQIHSHDKIKTLTIEPVVELIITKTIAKEIYMDKAVYVSVSVYNKGIYSVSSATVTDSISEYFELQDNTNQETTVSFSQGETKADLFKYTLKPTKTGEITIPATTATFTGPDGKVHTFKSEAPKVKVNGPNIVLTKTISPSSVSPGKEATVTITVHNQGNKDASVTTAESMPSSVSFVSGNLEFKEVMKGGKSATYSYVIRTKETGEVKMPATTATFIDMEGFKGERISNMPVLSVVDPEEQTSASLSDNSQSDTPSSTSGSSSSTDNTVTNSDDTRVQPGFEGSLMIFILICVFAVIKRREQ
ncbi:BatD family protein [Methanolobus sp.]|uniref:BatD family protein n=1 Tax=Methanolobus sp. TaxID=1874737 RepID=UPI0025FC8AC9|nr:BatD family protein [Methanolobus sp.]